MNTRRTRIVVSAVLAAAVAFPTIGRADDKKKSKAVRNAVVHFGQPQPQPVTVPGTAAASATHFLAPDDVAVRTGGTVTFVVNGGGHGIAIHAVSRNTTRDDVADDLCQGGANEADRAGRNAVCNGTAVTGTIVGTQNLAYLITDGRDRLVIDVPQNVANANPRVDDPRTSLRLLSTSGAIPGVFAPDLNANPAGGFLLGTVFVPAAGTTPESITPGNRIQVTFNRTGRFLVICQNRGHSLNDHMFGFVTVVDDDDRDHDDDDDDDSGHGGHN
jgi:plastocyanin